MTTHFAYPNVLPKEKRFIGCGRYRVMDPKNECPLHYHSVEETPNTPNRMVLEHAMQTMGAESYAATKTIFEKRDQPNHQYQGDSLDLAYLLAHIHRSRDLQIYPIGDIWSTGVVQTSDGKPILRKVDPTGFELKLAAFLSSQNNDQIFIVPAANFNSKILELSSSKGAKTFTLNQFISPNFNNNIIQSGKSIIKVLPNELPQLMRAIFTPICPKNHSKKWIILSLIVIFIVSFSIILFSQNKKDISQDEIQSLLFHGEYDEAQRKLALADRNQLWAKKISNNLNIELNVQVDFIFRKGDNSQLHRITFNSEPTDNLRLNHRDYYRLEIAFHRAKPVLYLYLYQLDTIGNLDRLFPSQLWGTSNPISPTIDRVNVPTDSGDWLFLSKLDQVTEGMIKEQLILVLSPWPAKDLEALYEKFKLAADDGRHRLFLESFLERLKVREQATFSSVVVKRISFLHEK